MIWSTSPLILRSSVTGSLPRVTWVPKTAPQKPRIEPRSWQRRSEGQCNLFYCRDGSPLRPKYFETSLFVISDSKSYLSGLPRLRINV